jgi:serine protease AprX
MLATSSGIARRGTPARRMATAAGLAALLLAGPAAPATAAAAAPAAASSATERVGVVVRTDSAAAAAAAKALIRRDGGTLGRDLPVIDGFGATVSPAALAALGAVPGLRVTRDARVRLKSDDKTWSNQSTTSLLAPLIKAAGAYRTSWSDPDGTTYSGTGGKVLTGAGIGVALIDSGVATVKGLNGTGKVVNGPDLSFESQVPNLRYLDTYGHGTHMAGIIAGQDPATVTAATRFDGMAPGAHIVSVKVASADGASDVSQVIAGIDWVVQHRNDPGFNIKVLNLSFGTESTQAAALDPLSFAVEQAWTAGIVVVVAAGNDGFAARTLTMPAANPDVIAVGAADPMGTDSRYDDTVADFSQRGSATRHSDVLAPGRSIVSLRDPGSYIDETYPTARPSTTTDPGQRFFRGSGTSQAAAMVSGSVALLLEQRPYLTPDQVKVLLTSTATPIVNGDRYAAGAGQIDVARASNTRSSKYAAQYNTAPTGLGTLEAARGGTYVYDSVTGTPLTGERDIFGKPWTPSTWTQLAKQYKAWNGGTWNGSLWAGAAMGTPVNGVQTWTPVTWTSPSWSGSSWLSRTWSGAVWDGRTWSTDTFLTRTWSGRTWSSAGWSGAPW